MINQPFHFPNGQEANNAQDLLELCKQYPDDATGFLVRQDLEKWLAYIGSYDAAECAATARQIDVEDRQKLEEFLNRCHSLTREKPVPIAETESKIEKNPRVSTPTIPETPPAKLEAVAPNLSPTPTQSLEVETPAKQPETASTEEITTSPPQPVSNSASKTTESANSAKSQSKPSFFQIVAKFIIGIFYRK